MQIVDYSLWYYLEREETTHEERDARQTALACGDWSGALPQCSGPLLNLWLRSRMIWDQKFTCEDTGNRKAMRGYQKENVDQHLDSYMKLWEAKNVFENALQREVGISL